MDGPRRTSATLLTADEASFPSSTDAASKLSD
jgi:hypothetical protein